MKKNWDVRTSVIDAYATFFLLSNTKFLSVSFDLLVPTRLYKLSPDSYEYYLALYYAQDILFMNDEHLPYAVLAIVILAIFVIIPLTVLTLYPFRIFQMFLNLFPGRWQQTLRTFMDAFLGCYKDGTAGTRDCRWFSALLFHLRIFLLVVHAVQLLRVLMFLLMAVALMMMVVLLVTVRPYNASLERYNVISAVFLQLLAIFFLTLPATYLATMYINSIAPFLYVLSALIALTILLLGVGIMICSIYRRKRCEWGIITKVREWRRGCRELVASGTQSGAPYEAIGADDGDGEN